MHAESNGRSNAANPRSTALGPFQFIKSTFLTIMRRHFPEDVARLNERDILRLRTDRDTARRAAEAFTKDNLAYLTGRGLNPTFGHLRLAFLLGPEGAARILEAPATKPVSHILGGSVIVANPFMRRMSARDLIARATRDVTPKDAPAAQPAPAPQPVVADAAPTAQPAPAPQPDVADAAPTAQPAPAPQPVVADAAPTAQPAPAPQPVVADAAPAAQPAPAPQPVIADAAPAEAVEATRVADAEPDVAAAQLELVAPGAKPAVEPKAPPAARATVAATHRGSARRGGPLVINVTCDERLASCRRWIDREVNRLIKVADGADGERS